MQGFTRLHRWFSQEGAGVPWLTAALMLLFFAWSAQLFQVQQITPTHPKNPKSFNTTVDAWFAGQLNLLLQLPPGVQSIDDVWERPDNATIRRAFWDTSLYKGKFYTYWGPVPALLLYAPARLTGVGCLSDTLVCAIFCMAAFAGLVCALRALLKAFALRPPRGLLALAIVHMGLCSAMPFLLRACAVYQVAITSGLCFSVWAFYFFLSGSLLSKPVAWRLAAGSACMGLAIVCRPSHLVTLPLLLLVTAVLWRASGVEPASLRKQLAAAWIPLCVIGVLAALYNYVRFDSFLEFGTHYQLTAYDVRQHGASRLPSILPSLYFFLLQPCQLDWNFPFFHVLPGYPGTLPEPFSVEPVFGLFATVPAAFLLLLLPAALRSNRSLPARDDLPLGASGVFRGILIYLPGWGFLAVFMLIAATPYPIVSTRFLQDFFAPFLLGTTLLGFHLDRELEPDPRRHRLFRVVWVVLMVAGITMHLGLSIMGSDRIRCTSFERLQAVCEGPKNLLASCFNPAERSIEATKRQNVGEELRQEASGKPVAKDRYLARDLALLNYRLVPEGDGSLCEVYLLFSSRSRLPRNLPVELAIIDNPGQPETARARWLAPEPPSDTWSHQETVLVARKVSLSPENRFLRVRLVDLYGKPMGAALALPLKGSSLP